MEIKDLQEKAEELEEQSRIAKESKFKIISRGNTIEIE